VTARRSRITPSTLATGAGMGLALGVVLYTVTPLGLSGDATDPWLPGSDVDPLLVLAWLLLLFGPLAAGFITVRRYTASCKSPPSGRAKARQVLAAGLLTNLVGALFLTAATTGTTAATLKSSWLRNWLYHGDHKYYGVNNLRALLSDPSVLAYSHKITAAVDGGPGLLFISIPFVVIALLVTSVLAQAVLDDTTRESGDPKWGSGGPPPPKPWTGPSDDTPPDDQSDDDISSALGVLNLSLTL
jgi:hypothetical protein